MAEIGRRLGTPPIPWQRLVLDVGLEIVPETGLPAYREIIFTVMRQQGKTQGVLFPVEIDRCLMWDEPQRVTYTAQTGSDARKKLLEDQVPVLKRSRLWRYVQKLHQAQGNEQIVFRNGSRIGLAASAKDAGHGFTLDLGVLDEFWADIDDRREQAMLPAMNTRDAAQLWLASTMGTEGSIFLNRKVEAGRRAAVADKGSGIAYFEWSIPLDADIEDPETWWTYMPALGWTVSEGAVAHALQTMDEAEWRRAYGNQPTKTEQDRVIPIVIWEAVCDPQAVVDREGRAPIWFALDVLPDRSASAIAASDGKTVELVEHRPGTGWMVDEIKRLRESWGGQFVIDGGGPAVSVAEDLALEGIDVKRLGGGEVVAACACMYDAIADRQVTLRTDPDLNAAVEGLVGRPVGDRFVWSRASSLADITPFMAASLAFEQARHAEEPAKAAIY